MTQYTTSLEVYSMSLHSKIEDYKAGFRQKAPEDVQAVMANATEALADTGIVEKAPKKGDKLMGFSLPNHNGETQTLESLLAKGPAVITFYRGGWCPYCNLELQAYQSVLSDISAAGATLIAITPELPDSSLSTIEKNDLKFEVLTDENSDYARNIGLVHSLAEELRPIYTSFGIHVEAHNGTGQFDLPLAATYVVAQDGTIISSFVDADYTKRQEPSAVVDALQSIEATA